jgi:GAF domain-containing protein
MGSDPPPEAEKLGAALKLLIEMIEVSGHSLLPNFGDQLLQSIVDAAGQIFGAAAASIILVDPGSETLEFKVSFGHGNEDVVGQRIPLDSGIAGYVVMTGQPIAIADVQQDPRFNQDFAKSTGYVPKSILATPLEWQERVIGVMEVLDKIDAPRFDLHDMEMLGLFAQQASIAIAQSQQYDHIAENILQAISTWAGEKAPEDLRPILEQLLSSKETSKEFSDISQLAAVLQALLSGGEAERKMALEVLDAIRIYLAARASRLGV